MEIRGSGKFTGKIIAGKVFCVRSGKKRFRHGIRSDDLRKPKWMTFTLDMEQLTEYDFWYADYHETPQCRMNIKYGSTVKRAQSYITGNADLNLWFQED